MVRDELRELSLILNQKAKVAANFPISVMFRLVGAPVEEIAGIRSSLETLGLAFSMDKDRIPEIHAS